MARIEMYLAKAGLLLKPEVVKKVLIANQIEEQEWERILNEATEIYMQHRNNGERISFLELLSDICYSYKKNKPTNYVPLPYKPVGNIPDEISRRIKENNAVIYDKKRKKIYIKGVVENSALYVLDGAELKKIREKIGLSEAIGFVIDLIK